MLPTAMIRAILAVLLAIVLTACSTGGKPTSALVEKAIALQYSQTQTELGQLFSAQDAPPPPFNLSHIKITEQKALTIQDLRSYRVRGSYDVTVMLPNRQVTQRENPFEVYLQRQVEGKTWRLARLQPATEETEETWATQLIPD